MFALAMTVASGMWGGYGFIYLPSGAGKLHPALARILHAYDPDYLVDAQWTYGDAEAISPGWHSRHVEGWPQDEEAAKSRLAFFKDDVVPGNRGEDSGAELCSPYQGMGGFRPLESLSPEGEHLIPRLKTILGIPPKPDLLVPEGLDPSLTLALGLRAGYPSKPLLPVGLKAGDETERLPSRYVQYALSTRAGHPGELDGLITAWDLTRTGLTPIGRPWPHARPVAVLGSTAEDFALAIALDRMFGTVIWMPTEWIDDPVVRWQVQISCHTLITAARTLGQKPIVTSISLSSDQLEDAVRTSWPRPAEARDAEGKVLVLNDAVSPEIVSAEHLDMAGVHHLACVGDYDFFFSSPSMADGRGGADLLLPVPAFTPRSEELRKPQRPFWEVDVEPYEQRMPVGRDLNLATLLAGGTNPIELVRSGRDGISFHAGSMGFIGGGMTLEQSVAKPRIHIPGLRGWVEALAAQDRPELYVALSQAGRRAMILTRLWGNRSAVARDLFDLDAFLREFKAAGTSDDEAYTDRDGVRLAPDEGCLTLKAAVRTLPGLDEDQIQKRIDHLLHIGVLHRGLVMPCHECERRAFYRIEALGENNTCQRCGASAYTTAAWRSDLNEPQWFYDLHGAVRELLAQDGDVPLLAGRALAATARTFEDVAELDFCKSGEKPAEIDILALADGQLIVGEAKREPALGTSKEANQCIAKLIEVSDLLGADEILLATTAPGPWLPRDTSRLLEKVAKRDWRFGKAPRVRVMMNLRANPQLEIPSDNHTA